MSEACSGAPDGGPVRRNAGAFRAGEWLSLAAAPTFTIMALLTGFSGEGALAILCSHDASPFSGMTAMYLLMSAFHVTPWLKLISSR
ncbi:MAG: hypothetical protein V4602_09275 [Pseudomonadota bacterium]